MERKELAVIVLALNAINAEADESILSKEEIKTIDSILEEEFDVKRESFTFEDSFRIIEFFKDTALKYKEELLGGGISH